MTSPLTPFSDRDLIAELITRGVVCELSIRSTISAIETETARFDWRAEVDKQAHNQIAHDPGFIANLERTEKEHDGCTAVDHRALMIVPGAWPSAPL